jgi:hypothetical protein
VVEKYSTMRANSSHRKSRRLDGIRTSALA